VVKTIPRVCELLNYCEALVAGVALQDGHILYLSGTCLNTLLIEQTARDAKSIWLLQRSALNLLQSIFTRHHTHRPMLLEELFAVLQQLPTTKKQLRTYELPNKGRIQTVTAMIMLWVQSVVTQAPHADDVTQGITAAYGICSQFITSFVQRCTQKDSTEFRTLLMNFAEDLLTALPLPGWPAAEMLLQTLYKALVQMLSKYEKGLSKFATTVIDLMSKLAATVATLQRDERDNPMSLPCSPHQMVLLDAPRPGDKYTCDHEAADDVLGMDCDRCHRWYHGQCAGFMTQEEVRALTLYIYSSVLHVLNA
jgi:hypothetical protein